MSRKGILVDRDGTLNEMVYDETHGTLDSPRRPEDVHLKAGAAEFLKRLSDADLPIAVVTNQPGLAKGTLSADALGAVNDRLAALLADGGARWDALYYCPHHPSPGVGADPQYAMACECRKPTPGLLLDAAKDHGLDLSKSWMVGDGLNDIQAGNRAGCRTILLTGLKVEQIERFISMADCMPDHVCATLAEAGDIILQDDESDHASRGPKGAMG